MSKVRVYYNSACPVCDAGIGAERRRMDACRIDAEWIDIHRDPERLEEIGASQEFVRERLHVVDDSGAVRVGAEAIGALWSQTPRLRVLAALLRMPTGFQEHTRAPSSGSPSQLPSPVCRKPPNAGTLWPHGAALSHSCCKRQTTTRPPQNARAEVR